jgi:hypothetical protein
MMQRPYKESMFVDLRRCIWAKEMDPPQVRGGKESGSWALGVTKRKFYEERRTMKRQDIQEKTKFGCMQQEFVNAVKNICL